MHSNKRLTLDEFVSKARKIHGNRYDYSKVKYVNSSTKVKIVCPEHGVFLQTPRAHYAQRQGCPTCSFNRSKMTQKEFLKRAVAAHGSRYDYNKVKVRDSNHHVTIICPEHGAFKQRPGIHASGSGCPKCGEISNRLTTKEFVKKAKSVHGNKYDYSESSYVDTWTKVTIICPEHGKFDQSPLHHTTYGYGCDKCSRASRRHTTPEFIALAKAANGNKYDYSNVEYVNTGTKVSVACQVHGEFLVTPANHLCGQGGCPKCASGNRQSIVEKNLVSALSVSVSGIKTNIRGLVPDSPRLEVDLYIPEHKTAVEVDGVYWHSERLGKSRDYHINKSLLLRKHGIQLLHFWDYEVEQKSDLVLSMIRQKIGQSKRLYARKLIVDQDVPLAEVREFLDAHHLQGYVSGRYAVGLRAAKSSRLACLMTFGVSRFSKSNGYEMLRFATHQGVTVVGGASRLLSSFMHLHPSSSIVSYADLRHSAGNLYKQLGFKFSHRSRPNYFWQYGSRRLPRYKTQKHKLAALLGDEFHPELSEVQNMERVGYSRVFDCGNLVYIKEAISAVNA